MAVKSKRFKKDARLRRRLRIRKRIQGSDTKLRISIFRSARHTYAQAITDERAITVASASTRDSEVAEALKGLEDKEFAGRPRSAKSVAAATAVGLVLGRRLQASNVQRVVFDRGGYIFHGRVRGVAEGMRKSGLKI